MKRLFFVLCVSVLVLGLAGFASAQQRGYQGGQSGQYERQDQPQGQYGTQDRWDQQQRQYGRQDQWDQGRSAFGRKGARQQQMAGNFHRASDLMDKKIKNQQGEDLGEVDDLIITRNGQVAYLIVARGGVLGVGDKYVPIPFRNAQFSPEQDALVLPNIDKQALENAPTISKNDWQRLEDPGFERQVFSYYGRQGQQMQGQQQYDQQQRPMQQQRPGQTGRY